MTALPTGEVTLLFTDVEGSTRLWELHGERMLALLADHDRVVAHAVADAGGVLQTSRAEGDSSFAVFADPRAAVAAAVSLQRAMTAHSWPVDLVIRTRAALHTGTIEVRGGTYYGPVVNRCVKLRALAHGGQTILSKATVDAAVRDGGLPPEVRLTDLGTHRLKDLIVAERVFELAHPDLPAGFPPLRSPDVQQHNLPERVGRFIGRSSEPRAITKALDVERLVTLVGSGGVGKTRLALEVAWARVEEDPGAPASAAHEGTWFVDLTGVRDDDDVHSVLATAVGVREQPGRYLLETVAEHLGDKAALVVIDNCEHLVPGARAVVQVLLDRCPHLRVLATSREALGLDGERTRAVPGLPLADAVTLFADRAGLALGTLGAHTAEAVERLCDRLEGIPYAIEIAAARAEAMGPDLMERGIGGALLEEEGLSVLEATLAWSHSLLDPEEQVLFRRLGVFAGTFPLDAVEAVVVDDVIDAMDVLDLVTSLVERSLVLRSEGGGYRQLIAAKVYAARLARGAGEFDALAAAHLAWCLALAHAQRAPDVHDRDRFDALRQVGEDLVVALDRRFPDDQAALQVQLAAALEAFWFHVGAFSEGRARLEAVLERGAGFRSHRAEVHRSAGYLARWQGDLDAADDHLERSRRLYDEILVELREAASPHVRLFEEHLALTLVLLGEVAQLRGDLHAAADVLRRALALGGPGAPSAAMKLGLVEQGMGETEAARGHIDDALAAAEAAGADDVVADCRRNLGVIARSVGDLGAAEAHYRAALELDRRGAPDHVLARTLINLAELLLLRGGDAADLLDEGLVMARAAGDRLAAAHGMSTLAELTAPTDEAAAAALHRAALDEVSAIGIPLEEALCLVRVAGYQELQGALDEAVVTAVSAVTIFRGLGDSRGVTEALTQLGRAEARRGNTVAAARALGEALESAARAETAIERADLLGATAWLAHALGRPDVACGLLEAARRRRAGLGVRPVWPSTRAETALDDLLLGAVAATESEDVLVDRALAGVV